MKELWLALPGLLPVIWQRFSRKIVALPRTGRCSLADMFQGCAVLLAATLASAPVPRRPPGPATAPSETPPALPRRPGRGRPHPQPGIPATAAPQRPPPPPRCLPRPRSRAPASSGAVPVRSSQSRPQERPPRARRRGGPPFLLGRAPRVPA